MPADVSGGGSVLVYTSEAANRVPNLGDTNRSPDVLALGWDVPPPPDEADVCDPSVGQSATVEVIAQPRSQTASLEALGNPISLPAVASAEIRVVPEPSRDVLTAVALAVLASWTRVRRRV